MLVSVGYVCDGVYNTLQDNINSPICLITWWPFCPKFLLKSYWLMFLRCDEASKLKPKHHTMVDVKSIAYQWHICIYKFMHPKKPQDRSKKDTQALNNLSLTVPYISRTTPIRPIRNMRSYLSYGYMCRQYEQVDQRMRS